LSSSLQKKNNKEPRTIDNRHHHCLVSFILKKRRQNANKEKWQKERTRAEESHEIAPSAFPEPGEKAKENENQRHSKAEEKRTDDHHASVIISVPALR
jgi:hypothetical protein